MTKLKESYEKLFSTIVQTKNLPNSIVRLDTTNMSEIDTSIFIAGSIILNMY